MSPTNPQFILLAKLAIFRERYVFDPVMDTIKVYPFQTIYKAIDRKFDKSVWIIRRPIDKANSSRVSLMQEVKIAWMLRHQHLWDYLDCYRLEEAGQLVDYAIISPPLSGSLQDVALSHLKRADKYQIIERLLVGVHYLHSHQISHLHLHPAHLLMSQVNEDWQLKIGNFVLPSAVVRELGTAYMAPEDWSTDDTHYSGKASDIWSIGVLIYWLFTQSTPYSTTTHFSTISDQETLQDIITGKIAQLPFEIRDLVQACLWVDPQKRVGEVAVLIKQFKRGLQTIDHLQRTHALTPPSSFQQEAHLANTTSAALGESKVPPRSKLVIHKQKKPITVSKKNTPVWLLPFGKMCLWLVLFALGICVGTYSAQEWHLMQGNRCTNDLLHCTWWIWLFVGIYSMGITWLVRQKLLPASFTALLLFNFHFFYLQLHFPSIDRLKHVLGIGQTATYDWLIYGLQQINMLVIVCLFFGVLLQLYWQLSNDNQFMVPPHPLHSENQ